MGPLKQEWTPDEEAALRAGVEKYGPGKWRAIQKDPKFGPWLTSRSNVDLKDKWRNMNGSPNVQGHPRTKRVLTLVEEVVPIKSLALMPAEATAVPISQVQGVPGKRKQQKSLALRCLETSGGMPVMNYTAGGLGAASTEPTAVEEFPIQDDAVMVDMESQVIMSGPPAAHLEVVNDSLPTASNHELECHELYGEVEEAPKDEEVENNGDKGKWGRKARLRRDKIEEIGVVPISFHVDMLSATLNHLKITRLTPPPLIPLCRIITNSAIRIIGSRILKWKDVYKTEGYLMGRGDFVLSLTTAKGSPIFVKDYVKTLWDPTWEKLSAEFDEMVLHDPNWSDMHGCMFLCWDGNHRLAGWMEAIHEDFMHDISKHAMVRATFIQPTKEGEMQLLASMNRINALNEVGAFHTDLKDQLYYVRRVAECSPDYFQKKFTPEELSEVEKIRKIEAKRGNVMWFPMTPYLLARVLFENDINKEMLEAREKVKSNRDTKSNKTLRELELAVQLRWANKLSKMLGVVNPTLGAEWFERITTMEPTTPGFHISLEKLHALRCANVANEVRNGWLAIALGSMRAQFGVPAGDRDFKQWLAKENWFTHLLDQARVLWENLREVVPITLGEFDDVIEYFMKMKMKYRKQLFAMHEPDMDYTKDAREQVDIQGSAKRLLWRYVQNAVDGKEILRMPHVLKMWSQITTSMYSDKYHIRRKGGMTQWEVAHCPWWLDFPEGSCPDEERTLYDQHQRDKLHFEATATHLPVSAEDCTLFESRLESETLERGKNTRKKVKARRERRPKEESAQEITIGPSQKTWVAQKRRWEEYINRPLQDLSHGTNARVAYVCGDVLNIGRAFASRTLAPEMASVVEHMREMCAGPRKRRGKSVAYSADFIFMDFPTDFTPDGFFVDVPSWNIMTDALLDASLQLADALIDDDGWVVCILAVQHASLFHRCVRRCNLQLRRRAVLRGNDPFGVGPDGVKSHLLDVYILNRPGASSSPPKGVCDSIDPGHFSSDCDLWTHYLPSFGRFIDRSTGVPYRGGLEKSPVFMQFLLELYCKKGGVVFDPFVGCGSTIRACKITERHVVSMDSDRRLLQAVEAREGSFVAGQSIVANVVQVEDEDEPYVTVDLDDLMP
ncbi:hypothetical protein O6H91_08G053900 [Diphasiastrum complanatum]|uniref:Uncharacterized protein n=2 Tax=Diphasiastrum complanatum TaxID=34168 RepID=A0ACC2CXR0_DIPCM|nr:hypothetical protein O6H91_08G053900 [Diphasiastrum complanatum]